MKCFSVALLALGLVACQDHPTALDYDTDFNAAVVPGELVVAGFDHGRGGIFSIGEGDFLTEMRSAIDGLGLATTYISLPALDATVVQEGATVSITNADVVILFSANELLRETVISILDDGEQNALRNFVTAGGCAMLVVDDEGSPPLEKRMDANNSLISTFHMEVARTVPDNHRAPITAFETSPLTGGDGGGFMSRRIVDVEQTSAGVLTELGDAVSLARNSEGDALAVIKPRAIGPNSGLVMVSSDINSFMDLFVIMGIGFGHFGANKNLFLNFIDYCVASSLSLQDQIILLIEKIQSLEALNKGQTNSLVKTLQNALKSIEKGKSNADNILNAFIDHVSDFIDDGVLTLEDGQPLIDAALFIIAQLSGG